MEIICTENSGFCFGVKRAIETIYDSIKNKKKIYTLGPIIHNKFVTKDLMKLGVNVIQNLDDIIFEDNSLIVIRTHGIPKELYRTMVHRKLKFIDLTCPFVKKIHNIVEQKSLEGYKIVIIGDGAHPEVIGINGWCSMPAVTVKSYDDLGKINQYNKICIVAQTTFSTHLFKEIVEKIETVEKIVYNTICPSTEHRQKETMELSKKVDAMLVIGDRDSSNTQKLFNICESEDVFFIETIEDLPNDINKYKKIGITTGASTPVSIIKEVIKNMSNNSMSFKEALDEHDLVTLNTGDIVKGTVIKITPTEVYLNLNYKSEGVISSSDLTFEQNVNPLDMFKIDDEIEAVVVRVNDVEGVVQLSRKRIAAEKGFQAIQKAFEDKSVIDARVSQIIRGGLLAIAHDNKIFIPASQASDRFVSNLNTLLGKTVQLKIIDINEEKKRSVGSVKQAILDIRESKSKELLETIEEGKKYSGVVKHITDFGIFVDIGGLDGLVHLSELSFKKIKHPSVMFKEGDNIEVYVLSFDKEKMRVSLGYKKPEDDPWNKVGLTIKPGDKIKSKIARLTNFGAFVEIEEGVDALIHISEISDKRIKSPSDVLKVGQEIEAVVTSLEPEKRKISLSLKNVNATNNETVEADPVEPAQEEVSPLTVEEVEEVKKD